jgi:hypothetical protein
MALEHREVIENGAEGTRISNRIWCADQLATHVFQLVETCDSYRRLMSRVSDRS